MAAKVVKTQGVNKGDFIAWSIMSQTWSGATITIKDDDRVIDTVHKDSSLHGFQMLKQGSTTAASENISVIIDVDGATKEPATIVNSSVIADDRGNRIGFLYNVCVEDAGDYDFNDYCINIIGWARQG